MRAVQASLSGVFLLSIFSASLVAASGCTKSPDAGRTRPHDAAIADMPGTDMPTAAPCTSSAQCDDGYACTIDGCSVERRCEYTTLDSLCATDQICVVGMGCLARGGGTCAIDADCDDGNFCNGTERCAGRTCISPPPESCDDGNACTIDTCDLARDLCVRETAPGCDAGVGPGDAGSRPFEAPRDYAGAFLLVPAQSSGCGAATFSISSVTFSATATTLTVNAGLFPLVQMPVPTGASFDVSYVQSGCGTYRLQGTFSDSATFSGTWTAVFTGGCGICPGMNATVIGVRS